MLHCRTALSDNVSGP